MHGLASCIYESKLHPASMATCWTLQRLVCNDCEAVSATFMEDPVGIQNRQTPQIVACYGVNL